MGSIPLTVLLSTPRSFHVINADSRQSHQDQHLSRNQMLKSVEIPSTVNSDAKPHFTDTRLMRKTHHYGQFALSL